MEGGGPAAASRVRCLPPWPSAGLRPSPRPRPRYPAPSYGLMAAVLTDHKDDFDGFMKAKKCWCGGFEAWARRRAHTPRPARRFPRPPGPLTLPPPPGHLLQFYQSFRNKKSGMMAWQISDTNRKLQVQPRSEAHADDSGTDGDMDAAAAFQLACAWWLI